MIDAPLDDREQKGNIYLDNKPQISKFKRNNLDLKEFLAYADQVLFKSPIENHVAMMRFKEPEMFCHLSSLSSKLSKHQFKMTIIYYLSYF